MKHTALAAEDLYLAQGCAGALAKANSAGIPHEAIIIRLRRYLAFGIAAFLFSSCAKEDLDEARWRVHKQQIIQELPLKVQYLNSGMSITQAATCLGISNRLRGSFSSGPSARKRVEVQVDPSHTVIFIYAMPEKMERLVGVELRGLSW